MVKVGGTAVTTGRRKKIAVATVGGRRHCSA